MRTVANYSCPDSIELEAPMLVSTHVALRHDALLVNMFGPQAGYAQGRVNVANLLDRMPFAILVSPDLL